MPGPLNFARILPQLLRREYSAVEPTKDTIMVVSRAEARQAFNHVLDNVLGRDDTSELKKALIDAGITNVLTCTVLTMVPLNHWPMTSQKLKPMSRLLMETRISYEFFGIL